MTQLFFDKDQDFLDADSFQLKSDGTIEVRHGNWTGGLWPGFTRTDEDGNEYDSWAKFCELRDNGTITVQPVPQEELDAIAVEAFKAKRLANIQSLTVTTTAGNAYQADRDSIAAMTARVIALTGELDSYTLKWSLAPTGTGVMDNVTLGDLREALLLATEQITTYWDINA